MYVSHFEMQSEMHSEFTCASIQLGSYAIEEQRYLAKYSPFVYPLNHEVKFYFPTFANFSEGPVMSVKVCIGMRAEFTF